MGATWTLSEKHFDGTGRRRYTSMTPNYKCESTIVGVPYEVIHRDGPSLVRGSGHPAFSFLVKDARQYEWLLRSDLYSTTIGFIRGDFDIHGDIIAPFGSSPR
jgi:hypothetical protein